MHTTNLRKVGGYIMLARPPAILDILNLHAGDSVAWSLLLAASDYSQPLLRQKNGNGLMRML